MSNESKHMKAVDQAEKSKLANYHFTQTIGQGNFGKVKLATFRPTNEQFAVKILTKEQIIDKNEMNLVQRELDIIRHFDHPNVIYVHQIIEDDKRYYIVMDYCQNGELFDYITSKKHLGEEEAACFFYQLINGVEYIHSKAIVHRDLKPENLLLTKTKALKIIDFGLSRNYSNDSEGALMTTKCGSPSYAAPEIIRGTVYNGFQTDVWCCGIILYAMLCGYLPFEGENNKALFQTIIEGKLRFPDYVGPLGQKIIREMLNPNPEKRVVIADIKTRKFYLKGKEQAERLLSKKKKKIKGLHIVNSNSELNAFRRACIPGMTTTKMNSPKNDSITAKLVSILKTETALIPNFKTIGMNNLHMNPLSSQMTPKDSRERLFSLRLNTKCSMKQIIKKRIASKDKANQIILTIPDKTPQMMTVVPRKPMNCLINLQTAHNRKSSKMSNLSLPTEPQEFDEILKMKFKQYISAKSTMRKEERKNKLGDSHIMRSKSKEDNLLLRHKKANCLPKLIKC